MKEQSESDTGLLSSIQNSLNKISESSVYRDFLKTGRGNNGSAPEMEYFTSEGFDFGDFYNWTEEINHTESSEVLQEGMENWDDENQQPEGFEEDEYASILRSLRTSEKLLKSYMNVHRDPPMQVYQKMQNVRDGYRFVENHVEDYPELMEEAMIEAEEDVEEMPDATATYL